MYQHLKLIKYYRWGLVERAVILHNPSANQCSEVMFASVARSAHSVLEPVAEPDKVMSEKEPREIEFAYQYALSKDLA